jgi:acetolactate synthase-1/2/3 large subunit
LPGTFFGPTAGSMGYAVPAAIGVKLYDPTVPVVAFAGDGGFAMTMSEIETAVRYGLAGTVFVVFDNAMYGTIAKHQENAGMPGHVGTDLGPVDFAAAAEAMGAVGFTVRRSDEFEHALAAALAADRPAVVHLLMENDTLAPWQDYAPRASKELS